MNKKVLVITPFFAPETHAAVFRAHKLVKYLKRMGWQPYVITVATNYEYNEDPSLLEELKDIPIYRTKYIEPSIRGVKMALGGADRTYKTLKEQGIFDQPNDITNSNTTAVSKPTLTSKLYHYILNRYLKNPDRFWTWKRGAITLAKKLIREEDIGTVFTTTLPFTANEIGIELKKTMPIQWVADFRDPITYGKRFHSSIPKVYAKQKRIQDLTFQYADKIVGTSSSYGMIFHDQYAGEYDEKFEFIPTGIDDDYIPTPQIEKANTLVFVGEYLKEYKDSFFKIYKQAIKDLPITQIPQIQIIGNKEINERVGLPYVEALELSDYVTFYDHMPQSQLYTMIEKAAYVLLINGDKAYWWCVFAKLIDYIALQKQVLAFVPEISEAKKELMKANTATFLKFNEEDSVEKLRAIFKNPQTIQKPNTAYCKRYLASSQVQAFINIFEALHS
ncbi:hypothetical protein [uncultured Dokdonia sp.]|uniref:hypothetical protein n=1 Tax=uncultured Dokdonia sp. TaxID=575653 RepID=UPI00261A1463|nr:hypothetical protein [uncultured Dokdonia sp.]